MLNFNLYFIDDAIHILRYQHLYRVCEYLPAAHSFRLFGCEFYCTLDMGHDRMSSSSQRFCLRCKEQSYLLACCCTHMGACEMRLIIII